MKKVLAVLGLSVLMTGCFSSYPAGMTEEQWKSITPEERKVLLLEHQKYREQQRLAQIKADAQTRQLQIKRDMEEKKRLEKLYNSPNKGNVVIVNILGGKYIHGKYQKRILEESYQVARGEVKKIALFLEDTKKGYHSEEYVYLKYDFNGSVYLYLNNPSHNQRERIALLRNGHWNCGSEYIKNLNTSYEKLHKVSFFVKEVGGQCGHRPRRHYY